MARTAGAVSNVSVPWQELQIRIGADYSGFITIGKKWYDQHFGPSEETVTISRAEYERLSNGESAPAIEMARGSTAQSQSISPRFQIEEPEDE